MFRGIKRFTKKPSDEAALEPVPVEDVDELLDDEDWDDFEDEEEEELPRKQRVLRGLRNAGISIAVLTVLAGGAGAGYVWYIGENETPVGTAIAQPVEAAKRQVIKTTTPDPSSKVGASIQMLTTPVAPGENASITVKTLPTASCKIVVEYNKVPSKDSGLVERVADEFGVIMWAWTVDPNAPFGKWPVTVTCTFNKRSAVVVGDLVVAKPEATP